MSQTASVSGRQQLPIELKIASPLMKIKLITARRLRGEVYWNISKFGGHFLICLHTLVTNEAIVHHLRDKRLHVSGLHLTSEPVSGSRELYTPTASENIAIHR